MNQINLTNEIYILVALYLLPWVSGLLEKFLAFKKGGDHEAISEMKNEIKELKIDNQKLKETINRLEHENASLRGFMSGISQHQEVKQLFEKIINNTV